MAKVSEYCTCKFSHCLHPDSGEFLKTDAVRVGNQYYHKDCYELKETIAEIVDYFSKEINPDVVFTVLRKTINTIVFPKNKTGIPADRLLFQLKYNHTHGGKIQYPGGLYYVVQDRESFEAWKKHEAEKAVSKMDFQIGDEQNESKEGSVKIKKQKSFEDILEGR